MLTTLVCMHEHMHCLSHTLSHSHSHSHSRPASAPRRSPRTSASTPSVTSRPATSVGLEGSIKSPRKSPGHAKAPTKTATSQVQPPPVKSSGRSPHSASKTRGTESSMQKKFVERSTKKQPDRKQDREKPPSTPTRQCSVLCSQGGWNWTLINLMPAVMLTLSLFPPYSLPSLFPAFLSFSLPFLSSSPPPFCLIPSPFPSQMHRHSLLTVLMNVLLMSSLGRGLPTGKESTLQMRMRRMICLLGTLHRVDCARGVAWEIPLMVMMSFLHTRSTDSSS